MFESALACPRHLAAYGEPDVCALAAAYAYGLARNRPFVDGNKRMAFVAAQLFLWLNGHRIGATHADCVLTTLSQAAGELPEVAFADWRRRHVQSLPPKPENR